MRSDPSTTPARDARWMHAEFAAALKDATEVPEAPASLYRRVPWRRSVALLAGTGFSALVAVWTFLAYLYPPPLVREALVHEHREATLRGDFQPDKRPMLEAMGLRDGSSIPGLMQLQRPCEIDGHVAYHVTTFFEKGGGMVTILAFERPLPDARAGDYGSWMGRHWRFAAGNGGKTVLLLADNAHVLKETERLLRSG